MRRIIVLATAAVLAAPALAQDFSSAMPAGSDIKAGQSQAWTFATCTYSYDDGSSEDALGLTAGGDMAWMQHFDPQTGCETITTILATVGWVGGAQNGTGCAISASTESSPAGRGCSINTTPSSPSAAAKGSTMSGVQPIQSHVRSSWVGRVNRITSQLCRPQRQ